MQQQGGRQEIWKPDALSSRDVAPSLAISAGQQRVEHLADAAAVAESFERTCIEMERKLARRGRAEILGDVFEECNVMWQHVSMY